MIAGCALACSPALLLLLLRCAGASNTMPTCTTSSCQSFWKFCRAYLERQTCLVAGMPLSLQPARVFCQTYEPFATATCWLVKSTSIKDEKQYGGVENPLCQWHGRVHVLAFSYDALGRRGSMSALVICLQVQAPLMMRSLVSVKMRKHPAQAAYTDGRSCKQVMHQYQRRCCKDDKSL